MHLDIIPVGHIQTNCYLVTCPVKKKALLIDPGEDDPAILAKIEERGAEVTVIVNTHAHFDHIGGNASIANATGAPIAIHADALEMLRTGGLSRTWGLALEDSPDPGILLEAGQVLKIGELSFRVIFIPGHAPGHIGLYSEDEKVVFVGDVLFNGGVGRTDLPGCDGTALVDSLQRVLMKLPDDTIVYPGHGPETTIGAERDENPYLMII